MFIGHFAVALAAKKTAPRIPLPVLFAAAQLVDLLWPLFLVLGWEHVRIDPGNTAMTPLDFYDYPITHSFAGALMWSLLFGTGYYLLRKQRRESVILAVLVFSHWLLDLLTHRPDLPLFGNDSVKFGLGLWNNVAAAAAVEFGMFAAGIYYYLQATTARSRVGTYGIVSLFVFLLAIHIGNIFGPPPPSEQIIAVAGNALWLFVLWAWWAEKHRITQDRKD